MSGKDCQLKIIKIQTCKLDNLIIDQTYAKN